MAAAAGIQQLPFSVQSAESGSQSEYGTAVSEPTLAEPTSEPLRDAGQSTPESVPTPGIAAGDAGSDDAASGGR